MADNKLTTGLNDRPKDAPPARLPKVFRMTAAGPSMSMRKPSKQKLSEDPREKLKKEVKQQEEAPD
ncbi:hypothetical protein [Neorhizobium sp. DT-125]|uniref:hypothetical protein n=1 Tax=Neorhizobium sp. DT-125 TaxID=3396163 RepID=UPI003F1A0A98